MKHTPGPWYVGEKRREFIDIKRANKTHDAISWALAYVIDRPSLAEEVEANARLIAAAPDMLEALSKCHHWLQGNEPGRAQYIGEILQKAGMYD